MTVRNYIDQQSLEKKIAEIAPLRSGFDLIQEHVVIADEHGNILYMNKAAERHTGYSFEESVGKNPGDLWGGHMPKEVYEDMWRTIKMEKKYWKGNIKNYRKNGEEYWQEVHINPVLDDANDVCYFVAIEPNITLRKNAEQKVVEERDRLYSFLLSQELKITELKKGILDLSVADTKKS